MSLVYTVIMNSSTDLPSPQEKEPDDLPYTDIPQPALPPMSDELMYQLIFSMEDQANRYVFDMTDGVPVQVEFMRGSKEEREARYCELPPWKPADGFRVMEKFVSSLKNPIFRERLREVLAKGKGVFRGFKDTVKEEPAIERLWFYFKEREMKRLIYIWYEQLTEVRYLERIGEPELDTSDLILSDFLVTHDCRRWAQQIAVIGEQRLDAEYAGVEYPLNELLVEEYRRCWNDADDSWITVCVEAPDDELAGCIGAAPQTLADGMSIFRVCLLYVEPRYRGLGISKLLVDSLCARAAETDAARLIIELSGKSAVIIAAVEKRGFTPFSERFSLDLSRWRREQEAWDDG
jgi:GNAT superfamily N-acetyltransferase